MRSVSVCAGDRVERMEAAGPELRRDHDPRRRSCRRKRCGDDAVDQVRVRLEGHVEARVGDDLLRVRLLEVPRDHPVAVDQVREILGRRVAGEPEVALRGIRVQDAAAAVEIGSSHAQRYPAAASATSAASGLICGARTAPTSRFARRARRRRASRVEAGRRRLGLRRARGTSPRSTPGQPRSLRAPPRRSRRSGSPHAGGALSRSYNTAG